eukprot:TRINITY_DN127507_c0_g1_i1.p1 TRINITY_DN127507_c0_g1~~TRINITY_DN127507_c0_g1_i1.p1  ORF type:complete len:188 (+),score=20.35 TRINITY_DN127507_c0_g1_i1:82-645(+)
MASLGSYAACQTSCNAGAMVCYSAAGFTFGAVTGGAGAPAAAVACNAAQSACMAACAAKFLAEGTAETAASGGVMGPAVAVGGAALAAGGWWMTRCKGSTACKTEEAELKKCYQHKGEAQCQHYVDALSACQQRSSSRDANHEDAAWLIADWLRDLSLRSRVEMNPSVGGCFLRSSACRGHLHIGVH